VNYGLKKDFEIIQKVEASLNGTIVIVRAGKITIDEKVSAVCPEACPKMVFCFSVTPLCLS